MTPNRDRERTSGDARLLAAIVAVATLVQLPGVFWDVPGGKAINNALRILDGQVPYRDFWTMYAPGHFYLGALLFKVFGVQLWIQGLAVCLLNAINAGLVFRVLRRIGLDRELATAAAACLVALLWDVSPELSSYPPALTFLLLALDRVVVYATARTPRALIVAGVYCGIAAWFKHDVAFHVTFGIAAGLTAAWLAAARSDRTGWLSSGAVLARLAGGAIAAAAPVAILLAWYAWPDVWNDLIRFPATDFRVVRGEGYPALIPQRAWFEAWLAHPGDVGELERLAHRLAASVQGNAAQLVMLAGLATVIFKRRVLEPRTTALALVSLAAMVPFWVSAHVQQNTHFYSLWLFSTMLGTLVWIGTPRSSVARHCTAAAFLVFTSAFLVRPAARVAEVAYFWPNHRRLDLPAAAGVQVPGWKHDLYQPIASFIGTHVPPSEPIYVGLGRNDAVVISNQAFYYLSGRRPASRYNELHPGVTDRADVQREIIRDIERLGVRCAVLWDFGWPASRMNRILEDRRRVLPHLGALELDAFFAAEFREVARYGEYRVLWRRDAPFVPLPLSHQAFWER